MTYCVYLQALQSPAGKCSIVPGMVTSKPASYSSVTQANLIVRR